MGSSPPYLIPGNPAMIRRRSPRGIYSWHCWPVVRPLLLPPTQRPAPSRPLTPTSTSAPPAQLRRASIRPSRVSCASSCGRVHPQVSLSKAAPQALVRPKASASPLPSKSPNGTGPFPSGSSTRAAVIICSEAGPPCSSPILTSTTSLRACQSTSAFTPISPT
jgi:hypothetical protein